MNATFRGREAREAQNEHILAALVTARTCVAGLIRDGFTVVGVDFRGPMPVVLIQDCPACAKLGGAWYRWSGDSKGPCYTMQVTRDGCRVEWLTTKPPDNRSSREH